MEEENKNLEVEEPTEVLENTGVIEPVAEEPTEVLGNTGVIEPVVEQPATEPVVETPTEPVAETPAPEAVQVEETPVVENPVVEGTAPASVPEVPAELVQETPVEQPVVQPAEPAPAAPIPEEPKKEEKKGSNKLLIIVALLVLVLGGGYAVWAFVLGGNNPKTEPKKEEEQKEEEKQPEEEKEEEVDYEALGKEVHTKYHKISGSIQYNVYTEKKSYDLTESNYINFTFSRYIYDQIKTDIEPLAEADGEYSYVSAEKARNIIKKAFDELFGHVIEYSDDYFDGSKADEAICTYLGYDKEKARFFAGTPNCGTTGEITSNYEITKVENEGNNIIVYETAKVPGPEEPTDVKSKWTYTKQSDNVYYFVKAEFVE